MTKHCCVLCDTTQGSLSLVISNITHHFPRNFTKHWQVITKFILPGPSPYFSFIVKPTKSSKLNHISVNGLIRSHGRHKHRQVTQPFRGKQKKTSKKSSEKLLVIESNSRTFKDRTSLHYFMIILKFIAYLSEIIDLFYLSSTILPCIQIAWARLLKLHPRSVKVANTHLTIPCVNGSGPHTQIRSSCSLPAAGGGG